MLFAILNVPYSASIYITPKKRVNAHFPFPQKLFLPITIDTINVDIHYLTKEQSIHMLTFIDESGYPHPTDSTKNPILLGVCIHENDIKPITNQIYKLKDSIYGKQDEIKSTKLIREATITKNRTNNKAYVEGMVDIITSYDAAIFAIIMDKPNEPIIVPEHHLPKQYSLLHAACTFPSEVQPLDSHSYPGTKIPHIHPLLALSSSFCDSSEYEGMHLSHLLP